MDGTGRLHESFRIALGCDASLTVLRYPVAQVLDYAELEQRVRAELPITEPYVLLAESYSGPIGISIAASAPAGLCGLILCCTFARNPVPALSLLWSLVNVAPVQAAPIWFASHLLMGRFATAQARQSLAEALLEVDQTVMRERMKAVLAVDVVNQLAAVKVPTLYLQARQDRLVGPAALRLIQTKLPTIEVARLEGPHFLLQTASEAAARVVLAFARRLGRSGLGGHEKPNPGCPLDAPFADCTAPTNTRGAIE